MHNIDYDLEYSKAMDKMAEGGEVKALFKIETPTGSPSKLTYIQQLLVRTKAFKEWFGDWESFAHRVIDERNKNSELKKLEDIVLKKNNETDKSNGNLSMNQITLIPFYIRSFNIKDISYTIDYDTLEPQAFWHGTKADEFYEFKTNVRNDGRPYSYFAVNKAYSERFSEGKTLYSVFTCIKNPYIEYSWFKNKPMALLSNVFLDYSVSHGYDSEQSKQIAFDKKYDYIKDYFEYEFGSQPIQFWLTMARDINGLFKKFLQDFGYDGVMYIEEFVAEPNLSDKSEITRAVTIFQPNQVKLADGRNTQFSAESNDIRYEKGGLIAPNGKKSNLSPEQYKLVRTPEFKKWFGDWENDPENSSKVVDENGEPLVVYHGAYLKEPFDTFDFKRADLGFHFGTKEQAKNRSTAKIYEKGYESYVNPYFLNIRTLFEASDIGEWEYPQRYIDMLISDNIIDEKVAKQKGFFNAFHRENNAQLRDYIKSKYGNSVGFVYNNKHEGEGKSFIVLSPNEIKLADGTNTEFNIKSDDIRYAEGGKTKMNRYCHLLGIETSTEKFAEGGSVKTQHGMTNDGKKGGYFEGRPHSEGGIKAWNTTTDSPIEVEGGEVIITKKAVEDDELYEFEGEMLTNKQILSKINESGGGVKFEDGGEIHQCNCSGKMFKFGGETLEDYQILNRMNQSYNKKESMKNRKTQYGHKLMRKMREGGFV